MTLNPDSDVLYTRILGKILNYLSYGSRTEKEITQRLKTYIDKLKVSVVEREALYARVLDRLSELKMLNDTAVLSNVISTLKNSSKLKNTKYIKDKLLKKGFNFEDVSRALAEFDSNHDYQCALVDFNKRFRTTKDILKIKKYLLGKGYSYDVVSRIIEDEDI